MKQRIALVLVVLALLASSPPSVSASPEKSAAKLDVTYYYLPG